MRVPPSPHSLHTPAAMCGTPSPPGWSNIRVEIWRNRQYMPKIALTWMLLFPFPLMPSHPPFHFFHCLCSLCTLILLFLLSNLLIPLPAFSLSPAICFPASSPMRAEGSSGSGTGRLPGCTSGVWAFPSFIFLETCWPSLMAGSRWAFCKCSRWLAGSLAAQTQGLRTAALEF